MSTPVRRRGRKTHTPDPDFLRTDRAVFIAGEINDELVTRLTLRIVALTRTAEPITILIDSDGGSVSAAAVIRGLLRTPSASGAIGTLTTVVTGRASSAAADLLAAGDYVVAYPHASIHFHGHRFFEEIVTAEKARYLQQHLLQDNEASSLALAGSMFPRVLWNYAVLRDDVRRIRESEAQSLSRFDPLVADALIDLPAFAHALATKVRERYAAAVLRCLEEALERDAVLKRYRVFRDSARGLSPSLRVAIQKGRDAEAAAGLSRELALLEALLVQRIRSDLEWNLAAEDFARLEEELRQLQAVADNPWQDELLDQLVATSELVLSRKDQKFLAKHRDPDLRNPKIATQFEAILNRAYAKLEPLWSFTVALCDALNTGENPMSPDDAWWLGLIDEVIGTPRARRNIPRRVKSRLLGQLPIAESQRFYSES